MTYLPREIGPRLTKAMGVLPAIVLSGMRQSGKSTLLQHEPKLKARHVYYTLDDFASLAAAQSNPHSLLDSPAIIDEVQRCPDLLIEIKRAVDSDRQLGRFILSGSANLALLGSVSETLAGRAGYFTLHPMTRRERLGRTQRPPFLSVLLNTLKAPGGECQPITDTEVLAGGIPPACLAPREAQVEWFRAYVQTYVERDVRQLSQITDLVSFRTFVQLTAHRTAQVLVISGLARDAKVAATTAARYLDLLETSFLVRKLQPYLKNRSARLIKSPKLYFADSGLAAYLAGVGRLDPGDDDLLRGSLYETYVAQNVAALLEAHLPDAELSYWHEQGRNEVDLVIEHQRKTFAIEVKAATRWRDGDLAGLRSFMNRTPSCAAGILAYNGSQTIQLNERLWAIPMGRLLE